MNNLTYRRLRNLSAVLTFACVLAACGETKPSRFYVLSAMPPADMVSTQIKRQGVVGVGPVEIPKYIDRAQMVTFMDPNQLGVAEFDRWAEPLANNFARVVAENLLAMTSADRVEVYPFPVTSRRPADRQVAIQVLRFDLKPDGVIDLWANWIILDQDGRRTLASGLSKSSETATVGDYKSIAAGMSKAIATFSQDVAKALNALPAQQS